MNVTKPHTDLREYCLYTYQYPALYNKIIKDHNLQSTCSKQPIPVIQVLRPVPDEPARGTAVEGRPRRGSPFETSAPIWATFTDELHPKRGRLFQGLPFQTSPTPSRAPLPRTIFQVSDFFGFWAQNV